MSWEWLKLVGIVLFGGEVEEVFVEELECVCIEVGILVVL